jgi:hypothetical protein
MAKGDCWICRRFPSACCWRARRVDCVLIIQKYHADPETPSARAFSSRIQRTAPILPLPR